MEADDLRRGMRVIVDRGEVRGQKEAMVKEAPPFETDVYKGDGETETVTDKVLVVYPGTSIDGGKLFGDIQEQVPLEDVIGPA